MITKFIYRKDDEACNKPYLSLFIDNEQIGEKGIYYLDLDAMQFKNIDIAELDNSFKPHTLDKVEPFWKRHLSKIQIEPKEAEKHL